MSMIRWIALALLASVALFFSASPSRAAEHYTYDTMGRLTDAAYDGSGSIHYTYDANGNLLSIVASIGVTGAEGTPPKFDFALGPSTPNPSPGPRSITFSIPTRGAVALRVFDVSGRLVATLYDRVLDPGRYVAHFSGDRWAGGVYFYRLSLDSRVLTGRMVVLR